MATILYIYFLLSTVIVLGATIFMFSKPVFKNSLSKYGFVTYIMSVLWLFNYSHDELGLLFQEVSGFWFFLFTAVILVSVQRVMSHFGWDFLFLYFHKDCRRLTWNDVLSGSFFKTIGYDSNELMKIGLFEECVVYRVTLVHPKHFKYYYNMFDKIIEVIEGELIINYEKGIDMRVKKGEVIKIERKQIHEVLTVKDTQLIMTCIK